MKITESLKIVDELTKNIGKLKESYSKIPMKIVLPPNREVLRQLSSIIDRLSEKINCLDENLNLGVSELEKRNNQVKILSKAIMDLEISRHLADKTKELIELVEFDIRARIKFKNQLSSEQRNVIKSMMEVLEILEILDTESKPLQGVLETEIQKINKEFIEMEMNSLTKEFFLSKCNNIISEYDQIIYALRKQYLNYIRY